MGRKLDTAIDKLYVLSAEAFDKSFKRGTDYDHGYAQGLKEAMQIIRQQQQERRK